MKRRFPILAKVFILGIGVSILTAGTAVIISYLNQRQRSEETLINNIDNSLSQIEYVFTESSDSSIYLDSLTNIRNYVEGKYDKSVDKKLEDCASFEEFANYYIEKYPWIYPHDRYGLVFKEEADFKVQYYSVLNLLNYSQISSAGRSVFLSFTDNTNTMVMLADSRQTNIKLDHLDSFFHVPGSYYEIKDSDYFIDNQHEKHYGYILDGYRTRFTRIYKPGGSDTDADVLATIYIEYDLTQVEQDSLEILRKELLVLGFSSLALVGIYMLFSYLLFVRNINKLSAVSDEISQRLNNKNMNQAIVVPIRSNDEMKVLSDSLIEMQDAIINYVDIIHKEAEERERNNAELLVASKIQLDSLPKNIFEDNNVSLRSYIKTAKEVGGDFYDYFYLDDHHLVTLISDVSGKGIPASLFMMKGKELIKSALQSYTSLVTAINSVNNMLTKNNEELLFITSFIGIIDFKKNEIRYVNAGQEKPYIISKDGVHKLDGEANIVLGVEENYQFIEESHPFNKDDILFMFTDGLNESINKEREEFGYQRIEDNLKDIGDLSLDNVIERINHSLESFVGDEDQFDDVTMIIVKNKDKELSLHYDKKDYSIITEIVDEFNKSFPDLSEGTKAQTGIIVDETVNNLISYEKREDLVIDVVFKVTSDGLLIRFVSNGDDYDPFVNHQEKYLEEFHSEIKEGGFGLSIIKDFAKSYSYKYKENHSIIDIIIEQ